MNLRNLSIIFGSHLIWSKDKDPIEAIALSQSTNTLFCTLLENFDFCFDEPQK